ncbi:MAG: 50S ribosomal protein L17 [Candidatus Omnitrophica bacterium]|nr:50S ribosomal protein L17 [Candidatus Omnitrophota bacterium]
MRHKKLNKKFDRNKPERDSMMNNLVKGLFIYQSITTTTTKAKEARRFAEKLITVAKKDDLSSRRKAFSVLRDETLVGKLFKEIAPLFKDRKGGYTRIIHLGKRKGDNAGLSVLELTEKKVVAPKVKHKKEKPAEAKPSATEKGAAKEAAPHAHEKPKEAAHEKNIPPKKEEKEIHKTPTHKAPAGGFVGTLRKFFRGRTK